MLEAGSLLRGWRTESADWPRRGRFGKNALVRREPEAVRERREHWILEAVSSGREGMRRNGGGPFGAIVVRGDEIVARGWNQVTQALDPTAHAEVSAIRAACAALQRFELRGCELYTSCEPCPMCLAAIYWARIDRVFYGCSREDAAAAGFDDQFIYDQIGLGLSERALPMTQLGCEAAHEMFRDWMAKPDKILY